MRKLLSAAFLLAISFTTQSALAAPNFLLQWDSSGEVSDVNGVMYLGQDNDPKCSASLFIDEIKSFSYTPYDGNLEIVTKQTHSPDGLFIYKKDLKDLNFDESNYLSMFLKTKERVLFLGEKCGSGGYFNIGSIIKLSEITGLK